VRSSSGPPSVTVVLVSLVLAGCAGGSSQTDPTTVSTAPTAIPSAVSSVVATAAGQETSPTERVGSIAPPASSTSPSASSPSSAEPPESSAAATTAATVAETGVPGLDSDDEFCAAWSRFAGTWQVLLVGATFLDDPDRVARWEVAAASVVLGAYDEMLELLPAELEPERQLLVDGYFGVLARRAEAAAEALAAADPDGAASQPLADVWLDALASRDPSTPDLVFDVPDELAPIVDDAAARLQAARVPIGIDPSMSVTVETPLTDEFLTTCPDQGTLAGGEVDG
jgi:hypothetical protein